MIAAGGKKLPARFGGKEGKMAKRILLLMLTAVLILSLAACGKSNGAATGGNLTTPTATGSSPEASGTRVFTDSTGRTVELPEKLDRIAITGPTAQIVLFALAPEKLVGISNSWDESAKEFFAPEYYNLPLLGQLYGGKGEMNLEELLKADPDVVIDVGEPKDGIAEDMDRLSEQSGIPFLHIDGFTATMGDTYRTLGKLLDLEEKGEELGAYCDEMYAFASDLEAKLSPEKKKTALYLLGDSGLNVIPEGSFHAELLNLIVENAAVLENPSSKGTGNETDLEQLLLWDPEVIFFAPDSIFDTVGEDPAWQDLQAIRSGSYYRVPFGPYNWMGFPPSVQRYLGILWAAKLLYPQVCDYDLYTEIARYFRLFYGCELTQSQFDALVSQQK